MEKRKNKSVRFVRIKGRIVPIKDKNKSDLKIPKRLKANFVMDENDRKIKSPKLLKEQGRKFSRNLGLRDAMSQANFLTGEAKKSFVKGIRAELRADLTMSSHKKQAGKAATILGGAIGLFGIGTGSKTAKLFGAGAAAVGGLTYLANKFTQKQASKNLRNLDNDLEENRKSWAKFFKGQKNAKK